MFRNEKLAATSLAYPLFTYSIIITDEKYHLPNKIFSTSTPSHAAMQLWCWCWCVLLALPTKVEKSKVKYHLRVPLADLVP